ncbi:MAG: hypothetical protein ACJA17_001235 [Polaribacter sp.]|jgi:hypothetical protein
MLDLETKEVLFKQCEAFLKKRLQTVEAVISSNQKALQSETKSSAGDKHETGRAMLQLEMEKAGQQLAGIMQMKDTLAKLTVLKTSKNACLGSIIVTDKVCYFLSISAGQLVVADKIYFAISISSPMGTLLLGKQENEEVVFNGKIILINGII